VPSWRWDINTGSATPEEQFAVVVEAFARSPGVTPPAGEAESKRAFGSNGLKVQNKIFAMLVKDHFVVKLPRTRVDELVASGTGDRFDPGHGRVMKEWLTIGPEAEADWVSLAKEAMEFVGPKR
jgi:hypothetical protein